jgi:O-acetylserine/cysteine efflux transporter
MMWKVFAAAVVSGAITYGLVYSGLRELYASTATLLTQLQVPFLALLGVVLLKEKLSLRGMLGMALAFSGVLLITGEPHIQGNLVPVFVVMAGSLCWALGQIMIRRLGGIGGMRPAGLDCHLASPQLFAASFVLEGRPTRRLERRGWRELGVSCSIWALGMDRLGLFDVVPRAGLLPRSNRVAPFLLLNPLVAILSSVLFLGRGNDPHDTPLAAPSFSSASPS